MVNLIKNEFIKDFNRNRIIKLIILFIIVALLSILYNVYITKINNINMEEPHDYTNYKESLVKDYNETKKTDYLVLYNIIVDLEDQEIKPENYNFDDWKWDASIRLNNYSSIIVIQNMISEGLDMSKLDNIVTNIYKIEQIEDENIKQLYNQLLIIIKDDNYYDYSKFMINNTKDLDEYKILEYQFVMDNNIKEFSDYRLREYRYILELKYQNSSPLLSIEEYERKIPKPNYSNYDEYKEYILKKQEYIKNEETKVNYALNNGIKYISNDFKTILNYTIYLFIIIGILSIARASSTISSEYSSGSIKLLLSSGVSRSKILTSKFISIIISTLIYYLMLVLIFILVGLFFFDIKDIFMPNIEVIESVIVNRVYLLELFKYIPIVTIPILYLATLSMLISTITLNNIIAISSNIFVLLTGGLFENILTNNRVFTARYTPLPYMDLTHFFELSKPIFLTTDYFNPPYFNLEFGIVVLILYIIILYTITLFIFKYIDIRK